MMPDYREIDNEEVFRYVILDEIVTARIKYYNKSFLIMEVTTKILHTKLYALYGVKYNANPKSWL